MTGGRSSLAPVTAICLEVAGPEQMAAWLERGWMPNLRALRDAGAFLPLRSVANISSGAIWPSFTTGTMPERHGQFFTHMQLEPGSYRIGKRYADDVPLPPFWDELEAAGLASILIDVPQTRPKQGFRGAHIVGWGGEYPAWPSSSAPPELMAEIHRRFGRHPLLDSWRIAGAPTSEAQYRSLCRDLRAGATAKAELTRWLLARQPFDLALTVFSETHWAMHPLWHLWDPAHPRHDPGLAARHGGILREVLSIIDALIGDLRAARAHGTMLVFSLSGMGPNHSGSHLLPEILARLGLGPAAAPVAAGRGWGKKLVAAARRAAPMSLIAGAKRMVPAGWWDRATRRLLYAGSGWASSRAFCLPNDYPGAVRVNLAGREPAGLVAPGEELNELLDLIETAVRELVVTATGRPAAAEVLRVGHAGGAPSGLPDLLVDWADDHPVEAVRSARLGEIRLASPERRTGAHRNEGVLLAAGPGIAARGGPAGGHVIDLAPTIAALLGVMPGPGRDGKVLDQLLAS